VITTLNERLPRAGRGSLAPGLDGVQLSVIQHGVQYPLVQHGRRDMPLRERQLPWCLTVTELEQGRWHRAGGASRRVTEPIRSGLSTALSLSHRSCLVEGWSKAGRRNRCLAVLRLSRTVRLETVPT
jgi:hypothetical protein